MLALPGSERVVALLEGLLTLRSNRASSRAGTR
jgi:hypothetical protein